MARHNDRKSTPEGRRETRRRRAARHVKYVSPELDLTRLVADLVVAS